MTSLRSEDSGVVHVDHNTISGANSQHDVSVRETSSGNNNNSNNNNNNNAHGNNNNNLLGVGSQNPEGLRRPSQVSFSQASEAFALGRNDNDHNNSNNNNNNNNISMNNHHGSMMANMAESTNNNNNQQSHHQGGSPGAGSSPSRGRRSVWREVINAVRTSRELLVDSFMKTAAAAAAQSEKKNAAAADHHKGNEEVAAASREEYPSMAPTFLAHPESRLPAQRVITVNKPNAMRNRALANMAIALSTLTIEMNESSPIASHQNSGKQSPVQLPSALQESPSASSARKHHADVPASPLVPSNGEHPNQPTRGLAPVTVEDIVMDAKVPIDLLSQPMMTLFEAQDTLQKCVSASAVLAGKFEVKIAPASVLLVDTEDDWGTNFEIAPRRLAYKASELEEALSDVLRRRGVALVFFDKKTLIEGMRQDDLGAEEEDDETSAAAAQLQAMLNAPLNEDGSVSEQGFGDDSQNGLFNGSFAGLGRGAPIAMQALRTRRTDIREADCGFVLGPTRQAESVALAVAHWNRERDELELVFTEVTATSLLDAMVMRSAQTGRPQGFLALMPLQELASFSAVHHNNNNNNNPSTTSPVPPPSNSHSPSPGSQSPLDAQLLGASSGMVVGGPNIPALEIVSQSTVTLDSVFPTFASLAQYHLDEVNIEDAGTNHKWASRIPLGFIDHSIATHITCCAVGAAAIAGALEGGLHVNDIVNSVNLSDVHMSVESDSTLQVHEVFSYMFQYSLKNPSVHLDVEWCPVVQTVHRANAAATVSVEQLAETLQLLAGSSSNANISINKNHSNNNNNNNNSSKKAMNVVMIAKVRIDIAVGTHGNSINGTGGGTRWIVICGYNEDSSTVIVLDPAPKRFGLFWSVSLEQLHRALTGHGYIILSNKQNTVGKSAADYIVCRPETHQIVLQSGISYDSPDAVLPIHSQLPPRPISRCPLSLAACAIARITGINLTFSQFLRSLPHPTPYGFTEDISLAHFAHVTRFYCHENKLPIHMTLCHLSVDAKGGRAVDEKQFSDRLKAASDSPRHVVIVNYGVTAFTSCCRPDRGTGAFALLLGFIPHDGKFNRYDRVLLQDCSDFISQQVFSVEVNELYRACCDVCNVSRRTMGFIDLRFVGDEERTSNGMIKPPKLQEVQQQQAKENSNSSEAPMFIASATTMPVITNAAAALGNREHNVSIALEGTLGTSDWEAIALDHHPELPRHLFKSPGIPVLTATASALVSLGLSCGEADLIAASFSLCHSAAATPYELLPTVLQAKPPTLATARTLINSFLDVRASSSVVKLLPQSKTNLLSALQAMAKYPKDIRVVLQYDCRAVHSTIRKFVSAGVVSAVKGHGERALIRVLEAEIASFLDVWEARAGSLMKTFDNAQRQAGDSAAAGSSVDPTTGVLVLYRSGAGFDESIFEEVVIAAKIDGAVAAESSIDDVNNENKERSPFHERRSNSPPPVSMITSPPSSPMMVHREHHHHSSHHQHPPLDNNNNNNNSEHTAEDASSHSLGNSRGGVGAARSRAMPYSLNTKKF